MITNERQYKITSSQLQKMKDAAGRYDLAKNASRIGSEVLAKAELQALESEIRVLEEQIHEYESLQSGETQIFHASNLLELPMVLIQARIAQHLSQKELAELVGLKEQQIQRYESEEYKSAKLSRLKEIADALKLNITEVAEFTSKNQSGNRLSTNDLDWKKFPIKEMYKRGWFEGFSGSVIDAIKSADDLIQDYVTSVIKRPFFAFHKKMIRSKIQIDPYALFAWECRVLQLAEEEVIDQKFQPEFLSPQLFEDLAKVSSNAEGPIIAKTKLQQVGIVLVVEPALPNTYLDGAAILIDNNTPMIGLTLRFDRLDNFWFVLFHELIHIKNHLKCGEIENIFDNNIDEEAEENIENETDILARNTLIPLEVWNHSLARFMQSKESVLEFAAFLKINPAIVAGRIRFESKNYLILNDLIGQNQVRKCFSDVNFGI